MRLGGGVIQNVQLVKNLGVTFDSLLTFKNHVSLISQSSFLKLKALYCFKNILSTECKIRLTNSLVLSKVEYGSLVYGPCLTGAEEYRIQKIQNACMRYSTGISRREHITPFIRLHKWLRMRERWIYHLMCLVHAIILFNEPKYLKDKINFRVQCHNINLRFVATTLNIPKHNTVLFQSAFSYASAHYYGNLPRDLRSFSYHIFKSKLKLSLLGGQIRIDS